jgi:hypothetical protein
MAVGSLGFMPKRRDKSPIKKTGLVGVTDDGSPVSRIHARGLSLGGGSRLNALRKLPGKSFYRSTWASG